MKLSVSEAAQLLAATNERVFDWIEDGSLPAQRIRGEYRINRTELLEWATERQIVLAASAFADPLDGRAFPSVADALIAGGLMHDDASRDMADAVRKIVTSLPLAEEADREALRDLLIARESFGFAPAGDGIAVPQVRTPVVLPLRKGAGASLLTLTFLAQPLTIPRTNASADSIFFLVAPTVTTHLAVLSKLTACINDEHFHAAVKRRKTAVDIVNAAAEVEGAL